jgi:cytochrome c biogenesis protein CcdA
MQPYPFAPPRPPHQPGSALPQPRSVQRAVRHMYTGAALTAIGVVQALAAIGSLKSAIIKHFPKQLTATQIHDLGIFSIVGTVVIGLIAIGLWLWMARANGKGRNWARIVSAVLFAIGTLSLLLSFTRASGAGPLMLEVLVWLAGLGAILNIFSKKSRPFFRQQSGR